MKRKSPTYGYRLNKDLGWRYAKIGEQYVPKSRNSTNIKGIKPHNVVIVRLKDCKIREEGGRKYYDASEAPIIPISGHGLTSTPYGVPRLVQKKFFKELRTMVYLVYDGRVYTKTLVRVLYSGKVREASEADRLYYDNFSLQYVIDKGANQPGTPIPNYVIDNLKRRNIDFLNLESVDFEYSHDNGFNWAILVIL
jgi:hypothetical protein